jgi:hypothetical protein
VKANIPPAQRPVADAFEKQLHQLEASPTCGVQQKKMLEETESRLKALFEQMAAGKLPQDVCDKLNELIKGILKSFAT